MKWIRSRIRPDLSTPTKIIGEKMRLSIKIYFPTSLKNKKFYIFAVVFYLLQEYKNNVNQNLGSRIRFFMIKIDPDVESISNRSTNLRKIIIMYMLRNTIRMEKFERISISVKPNPPSGQFLYNMN